MSDYTSSTCQFCEKFYSGNRRNQIRPALKYEGKVKYSTRHYAHFECFLNHKTVEDFKALGSWRMGRFPYKLLQERGLQFIAKAEGK